MSALVLRFGGRRLAVRDTHRPRHSVHIGGRLYDRATVRLRIDGQTIRLTDISMEMSDPARPEPGAPLCFPLRFSSRINLTASGAEAFLRELSRVPLPISMSATTGAT